MYNTTDSSRRVKEIISKREDQRLQIERQVLAEMRQEFDQKQQQIRKVMSRSPPQNKGLNKSTSQSSFKAAPLDSSEQNDDQDF